MIEIRVDFAPLPGTDIVLSADFVIATLCPPRIEDRDTGDEDGQDFARVACPGLIVDDIDCAVLLHAATGGAAGLLMPGERA